MSMYTQVYTSKYKDSLGLRCTHTPPRMQCTWWLLYRCTCLLGTVCMCKMWAYIHIYVYIYIYTHMGPASHAVRDTPPDLLYFCTERCMHAYLRRGYICTHTHKQDPASGFCCVCCLHGFYTHAHIPTSTHIHMYVK